MGILPAFIIVLSAVSLLGLPIAGLIIFSRKRDYKLIVGLFALVIDIAWIVLAWKLGLGLSDLSWHAPAIIGFVVAWGVVFVFVVTAGIKSQADA